MDGEKIGEKERDVCAVCPSLSLHANIVQLIHHTIKTERLQKQIQKKNELVPYSSANVFHSELNEKTF